MKLFTLALLVTSAFALPRSSGKNSPGLLSLGEGQQKCGDQAKLFCCNGQVHSGSAFNEYKDILDKGILGGLLGDNSRHGLGVYDQCSEVTSDCMSILSVVLFSDPSRLRKLTS